MLKIESILEEIEKGCYKESVFLKTDKFSFKELIEKMFQNPNEYRGINMYELLMSEDIDADDEDTNIRYYTSTLSYKGNYLYINWSVDDFSGFEIDDIKHMYFKKTINHSTNSKKHVYADADGNEIYLVVERTLFNYKGNFVDKNMKLKDVIKSLCIKIENNVVISYDKSAFNLIYGISKLDLTSDLARIFYATLISYNEKKDFYRVYSNLRMYQNLE